MQDLEKVVGNISIVAEGLEEEHPDLAQRLDIVAVKIEADLGSWLRGQLSTDQSFTRRVSRWVMEKAAEFTKEMLKHISIRYIPTLLMHTMPHFWNAYFDWKAKHPNEKIDLVTLTSLLRMSFWAAFDRTKLGRPLERTFEDTMKGEEEPPSGLYEGPDIASDIERERRDRKKQQQKDEETEQWMVEQRQKREESGQRIRHRKEEMGLKDKDLSRKVDRAIIEKEISDESIRRKQEEREERVKDLAQKQREMNLARQLAEEKIKRLQQELDHAQKKWNANELKIKQEEERLLQLEQRHPTDELQTQIQDINRRINRLEDNRDELKIDLESADEVLEERNQEVSILEKEIQDLQSKITQQGGTTAGVVTSAKKSMRMRRLLIPRLESTYINLLKQTCEEASKKSSKFRIYVDREDKQGLSRFLMKELQKGLKREVRSYAKATAVDFKLAIKKLPRKAK
jgi:colicin import membrane protein